MEQWKIESIRVFVKVVQLGGFSRAAEHLRLPKSTVSRTVSSLENEIGTKLLVRTTRSLAPTAAGLTLFESSSGAVQALEDAMRAANGKNSSISGRLKITAPEDLGTYVVSPLIAQMSRKFQGLSFDLHYTDEMLDLVREGYDIAIRIGKLAPSRFKATKLGDILIIPVASPDYLSKRPKIAHPNDLSKHDCLAYRAESTRAKKVLRSGQQVVQVAIQSRITANMMSSLLSMAKQSAGIAFVPKYLCQDELQSGSLLSVLPGWAETDFPVYLVSPLGIHSSNTLKIVGTELVSGIKKFLGGG